jgi:hypothetical protein
MPEAEGVQIELLRQASAWRTLDMVGQMNQLRLFEDAENE